MNAAPAGPAGTLAQAYRHFGEADGTQTSSLYRQVAVALSGSAEALHAIEAEPVRARHPERILAALHDLALGGRAPALAAAYAAEDGEATVRAVIGTLVRATEDVVAIATRRKPQTFQTQRCAVLYPAIAEAAYRSGADAVGLVDVGPSPALNLHVDQVGIRYSNGQTLGDSSSPLQLSASLVGDSTLPPRAVPEVVARIGIGPEPVDLTDPDEIRWLHACVPPDQRERAARLAAEIALAASAPALLLRGNAVELLPKALTRVPATALPVVITTWSLSRLSIEKRRCFVQRLGEAAAGRMVAWVSAEGVGVAPSIPTLGDRPASGHSIIGLSLSARSGLQAEALGRCWSRGRTLSWLAPTARPPLR